MKNQLHNRTADILSIFLKTQLRESKLSKMYLFQLKNIKQNRSWPNLLIEKVVVYFYLWICFEVIWHQHNRDLNMAQFIDLQRRQKGNLKKLKYEKKLISSCLSWKTWRPPDVDFLTIMNTSHILQNTQFMKSFSLKQTNYREYVKIIP